MTETLCLSNAVLMKAGKNVNSTIAISAAYLTNFINQAEAVVMADSRVDWVTKYSGLATYTKLILEETTADLAAMYLINYDMSGYTSRTEAQTMLDVLHDAAARGLSLLKDDKVKTFLGGT